MKKLRWIVLSGASLLPLASAHAQDAPKEATVYSTEDIIVTARRRQESLQDVPQTVNAVTTEAIEKLNLQNFKDIQNVVPGLQLAGGVTGSDSKFSLRGVTFDTLAGSTSPTVQFYINEASADSNLVFQSMFDVGQIEVLRGPQGTLRGRSAPSGAITLTTKGADLSEVGGYVNMTGTTRGNINVNGAVGVPLIDGVLGIRLAGLVDHNELDSVTSVNNGADPFGKTEAMRASLRFEPTDTIGVSVMYQHMDAKYRSFQQVDGFSNPFPMLGLPAGGPVISGSDRLAVSDFSRNSKLKFDLVTANADWGFAGQKLSYVGGYSKQTLNTYTPQDPYNVFPGFDSYQAIAPAGNETWRHELRLASEERIAGIFDYTIGAYYEHQKGSAIGVVDPSTPLSNIGTLLSQKVISREVSFFGTVTAHITDRTELTGGARHIDIKQTASEPFDSVPGEGNSLCLTPSNFCLPGFAQTQPIKDTHWVWNASLSHRLSDDFLIYGNAGTSYRPPFSVVILSPLEVPGFQSASDLHFKPPEKSLGFEVGFKASFLDKRAHLNVAAFYQKFDNHNFLIEDIYFDDFAQGMVTRQDFTADANAIVKGIEADASFLITPRWNVSAGFSYAKGTVDNDYVPCNDSNFDGIPDNGVPTAADFAAAGVLVARCKSNQSISTAPRWTLSVQSEYSHPVSNSVDGFIRGLFNYYPENPYRNEGVVIDNYSLLNVYAGIRSPDNAWEISLYSKNALNTSQVLSRGQVAPVFGFIPVNYRPISYTPRREFGLNVRYSFGSR
ncbi:iron complex outermembrane receptor protein [Novosphingobium sp. PhB165]|uniref:TonB-dependent receptor n=1 Tax=Novosphingobium sp. PhB165 TaxID=2485105 RepID=UPI00104D774C|nr:TonB-dependent receptor [Novosphingobium sp. PhB165]TCM20737.1 iron complex outermembrane receptor protein [Novosphingobium sp. PhB165]